MTDLKTGIDWEFVNDMNFGACESCGTVYMPIPETPNDGHECPVVPVEIDGYDSAVD